MLPRAKPRAASETGKYNHKRDMLFSGQLAKNDTYKPFSTTCSSWTYAQTHPFLFLKKQGIHVQYMEKYVTTNRQKPLLVQTRSILNKAFIFPVL